MEFSNSKFNELDTNELNEVDGGLLEVLVAYATSVVYPTALTVAVTGQVLGVTYHSLKGVCNYCEAKYRYGFETGLNS